MIIHLFALVIGDLTITVRMRSRGVYYLQMILVLVDVARARINYKLGLLREVLESKCFSQV